jgi:hypothetical protein
MKSNEEGFSEHLAALMTDCYTEVEQFREKLGTESISDTLNKLNQIVDAYILAEGPSPELRELQAIDGSLDKILFMFSGGSVMEIMTTTDYCENGVSTLDSTNQYSLFELKAISSDQMDEIIKFRREKVRQKIRDEQEAERIARRKYYEELKQEFEEGNGTSHDK